MLTRLRITNFKQFDDVDIELGNCVVLIGPNNSGKTTALQALALWDIGLRKWNEKRGTKSLAKQRTGVTINRNDLISIPVPAADLLWRSLHVRDTRVLDGKQETKNVRIGITVDGIAKGKPWTCGLEFDYANSESFYCRPLKLTEGDQLERMPVPSEASDVRVAFLPPMSGLAAVEPKWEPGRIGVLLGEGQTAQVLRNLCAQIHEHSVEQWNELCGHVDRLFGVTLQPPLYIKERGEITMSYREPRRPELDISSSGRGLQQTLLLLTHLYANTDTVLLLDEPDAHLEVLRQRQTYQLITEIAAKNGSQIIAASHSEVVLNEAADKDIVIAFVGKPHRINDRGHQVLKALKSIGFDQCYQAEQKGWVIYLEGSTDLRHLQCFAETLSHGALSCLQQPFVHYIGNEPNKARDHFRGLREACPKFIGIAIFDRLNEGQLQNDPSLVETMWSKREIENYLLQHEVLISYARGKPKSDDLIDLGEADERQRAMEEAIGKISEFLQYQNKPDPWSSDIKATDDFLDPLFEAYYKRLGQPNIMRKANYHILTALVTKDRIDQEIAAKLDLVVAVAEKAKPRT